MITILQNVLGKDFEEVQIRIKKGVKSGEFTPRLHDTFDVWSYKASIKELTIRKITNIRKGDNTTIDKVVEDLKSEARKYSKPELDNQIPPIQRLKFDSDHTALVCSDADYSYSYIRFYGFEIG